MSLPRPTLSSDGTVNRPYRTPSGLVKWDPLRPGHADYEAARKEARPEPVDKPFPLGRAIALIVVALLVVCVTLILQAVSGSAAIGFAALGACVVGFFVVAMVLGSSDQSGAASDVGEGVSDGFSL